MIRTRQSGTNFASGNLRRQNASLLWRRDPVAIRYEKSLSAPDTRGQKSAASLLHRMPRMNFTRFAVDTDRPCKSLKKLLVCRGCRVPECRGWSPFGSTADCSYPQLTSDQGFQRLPRREGVPAFRGNSRLENTRHTESNWLTRFRIANGVSDCHSRSLRPMPKIANLLNPAAVDHRAQVIDPGVKKKCPRRSTRKCRCPRRP